MMRPRSQPVSAAARMARPLGVCLALLGACLAPQGALARIQYNDADRYVYARANALGDSALPDEAHESSSDFGIFDEGFEVSAAHEGASSSASASQLSSLTPDSILARGTYSAIADGSVDASASAVGEVWFVVDFAYHGTSSRAYTVTASLQQDDANGYPADLRAFGESLVVTDGADSFGFSGLLIPGRRYTVFASIRGTAAGGYEAFSDTVTSQSSGGTFEIEISFATEEVDCTNGFDDDGDELVDEDDPDCAPPPPPEDCDNGIDDDGDGLADGDDPDCQQPEPEVGLRVRCLHEPLWPQDGEPVTIHADTFDREGASVVADRIEIFAGGRNAPAGGFDGVDAAQLTVPVAGDPSLFYGCQAALGEETASSGFRSVEVEDLEDPDLRPIPVVYSGPPSEKIDIVFLPESDRHPRGAREATFQAEIFRTIREGILAIPWFMENQAAFNFWLGRDTVDVFPKDADDASKKCKKNKPGGWGYFGREYGFAEASGVIHGEACRDNSSLKLFTTRFEPDRLQVVAHEIGHAAFTLSDEYTTTSTLYFSGLTLANVLANEQLCIAEAITRGKDSGACRPLNNPSFFSGTFWLFEPDYRATTPRTPDLMQQVGSGACDADDDGAVNDTCAVYRVGDSEIDRMDWIVDRCEAGRC